MDVVVAYRTVNSGRKRPELDKLIGEGRVDVITFTSPSTVSNFFEIMGKDYALPADVKIACIGPVTEKAAVRAGLRVDIFQESYTIPGLVQSLLKYYKS